MNRREFTRNLAALGLAPLVPATGLAKAMPVAAAPVGSGTALTFINAWSSHYVRKTGSCSPEQLARHFGLVPETAQIVTNGLIEKGVLAAPNALGVSRAINPLPATLAKAPKSSPSQILEKLQETLENAPSDGEPASTPDEKPDCFSDAHDPEGSPKPNPSQPTRDS